MLKPPQIIVIYVIDSLGLEPSFKFLTSHDLMLRFMYKQCFHSYYFNCFFSRRKGRDLLKIQLRIIQIFLHENIASLEPKRFDKEKS